MKCLYSWIVKKSTDVQTKNSSRKRSQKVYETGDLAPGEHTITLVNKTGEPIATEGIYTLNNNSKGMFELEATSYDVEKGKPATVTIKRVGGSKGTATVRFITDLEQVFTVRFTKIQLKM